MLPEVKATMNFNVERESRIIVHSMNALVVSETSVERVHFHTILIMIAPPPCERGHFYSVFACANVQDKTSSADFAFVLILPLFLILLLF